RQGPDAVLDLARAGEKPVVEHRRCDGEALQQRVHLGSREAAARHEQLRAAVLAEALEPGLDEVNTLDHREPLAPTLACRAGQLEQATEALVARGRDLVSHAGCASAARSPPATARAPVRSCGGARDTGHAPEETRDARRWDSP